MWARVQLLAFCVAIDQKCVHASQSESKTSQAMRTIDLKPDGSAFQNQEGNHEVVTSQSKSGDSLMRRTAPAFEEDNGNDETLSLNGNKHDGLASFLESVDKTKALLYVDIPEDCKTFATHCGASNEVVESLSSWDDASAAFESCCLAGRHETSTCSSIASESFGQRAEAFALDEAVCKEMVDLYGSHIQNQLSRKTSLSESNHATEIAARIVNRAWVLKDTAPKFVAALLGGIAVVHSGRASLTQVSLGAVVLAMSTILESCSGSRPHNSGTAGVDWWDPR